MQLLVVVSLKSLLFK